MAVRVGKEVRLSDGQFRRLSFGGGPLHQFRDVLMHSLHSDHNTIIWNMDTAYVDHLIPLDATFFGQMLAWFRAWHIEVGRGLMLSCVI